MTVKQQLLHRYDALTPRDKLALFVLALFLVVVVFGGGMWWLHQQASQARQDAQSAQQQYFWMRSQAPNIKVNQVVTTDVNQTVQQVASNTGISVQTAQNGNVMQLSFTHNNAAVIGNFIAQLANQGINVERLNIRQIEDSSFIVEASVVI